MYSVLNCHNVAKRTEFYLGWLQFSVTSTGNAGCFKKSFGWLQFSVTSTGNAGCFKKSFTTLEAYIN
jgi:hypothetical protein